MDKIMKLIDMNMVVGFSTILIFCGVLIYMKKQGKKFGYYEEIKLALIMGGTMLKDAKVKAMMSICFAIVQGLERAEMASEEKRKEAIKKAIEEIHEKCKVTLDENVVGAIIDIAVAHMKENQK